MTKEEKKERIEFEPEDEMVVKIQKVTTALIETLWYLNNRIDRVQREIVRLDRDFRE